MGLFNKKQEKSKLPRANTKKLGLNELSEDTLFNVAGGQSYHSKEDMQENERQIRELVQNN